MGSLKCFLLTFGHNKQSIHLTHASRVIFLYLKCEKIRRGNMNTATHSFGDLCTGCVAAITVIVTFVSFATILWVLFL